MTRYNDVYFDFGMTPGEAEMLYRHLNGEVDRICREDPDQVNLEATLKLRDRVLNFTRKHPCRYGLAARL